MKSTWPNLKNNSWMRTLSAIHFQPVPFCVQFSAENSLPASPPPSEEALLATRTHIPLGLSPQPVPPSLKLPNTWVITFLFPIKSVLRKKMALSKNKA